MSLTLRATILLVDDDVVILKFLRKVLEKEGHACQTVTSVRDAKKLMEKTSFDLLITDMKMPGESGIEILKHASDFFPQTGRVLLTGFCNMNVAQEVLQIGVYGYLIKPLGSEMIRITVQNALRHMLLENQMQAHLLELKKELNSTHSALEGILNNIEIGVAVVDRDKRILSYNRALVLMFPDMGDHEKKYCYEVFTRHQEMGICKKCLVNKAFNLKKTVCEERVIQTTEGHRRFRVTVLPSIENHNVRQGMILYHDITDVVESQADYEDG